MQEYFDMYSSLDPWMKVYWGCALIAGGIFVIQMVLTLIGMDSTDVDVDFDGPDTMDLGGSISLFSIRNLINFFCGFGWAGVCLNSTIPNRILLLFVAILVGIGFVLMFFYIKKQTNKLQHNGAFKIEDCIGKTTDVYLRIPGQRQGKGKIQVSINGSIQEIDAMTDGDNISSGSKVKVESIIDPSTVLVSI